jgi:hypothetical protein
MTQHLGSSKRTVQRASKTLSRRRMLQIAAGAATALAPALRSGAEDPAPVPVAPKDRKLLFVFCAFGGASIIDSFLPIPESAVGDAALAATLNTYPDALVEQISGSNLRHVGLLADSDYSFYVKPTNMGELLRRHGQDAAVIAHDVSSVNHAIGQQRSLNGAGINRGRTLMEAMAVRYGGGMSLPSCNMARGGFIEHGSDVTLPLRARHELITAPLLFAMGTHGYRGLAGLPASAGIERARSIREQLDRESVFGLTFGKSPRLQTYLQKRRDARSDFEAAAMIDKLLLLEPGSVDPRLGLVGSEIASVLRDKLPVMEIDEVQAQLALGFLLTYHGMSSSIAVGLREDPPIVEAGPLNTPIAFDFSHQSPHDSEPHVGPDRGPARHLHLTAQAVRLHGRSRAGQDVGSLADLCRERVRALQVAAQREHGLEHRPRPQQRFADHLAADPRQSRVRRRGRKDRPYLRLRSGHGPARSICQVLRSGRLQLARARAGHCLCGSP